MTDYSQLYLVWPPIAILLIGLAAGWFLQRHVLVRQMEELETQHLDLLRSAEDEMHAAREEARLQGQKLDEAQRAITLGYERLTLLDRRLKEAESRMPAELPAELAAESAASAEVEVLRQELAEQQVFAERLNQLERDLAKAKAEASEPAVPVALAAGEDLARTLREREATIKSLRYEVAVVEELRLRLSDMVSELGLAQSQVAQITRERNELKVRAAALIAAPTVVPAAESSNELVRKLADAIARRQELELALGEARQQLMGAYAERDRALGMNTPVVAPRAMAAAAGAGSGSGTGAGTSTGSGTSLGFSVSNWQAAFPAALVPLHPVPLQPSEPPLPGANRPFLTDDSDRDYVAPACPLLSPSQLTGGISQLLFENRIQFAPDRADILPDSKLLLEDIADLILTSDPVRFVIEGHTERGDARASFYLSERRAMAVLERLAKLGVSESRMLSVGYGDTRPIDENSSYEGRMRNRRVEIRVLGRT